MEISLENSGESVDLTSQHVSLSMGVGDSNVLILPSKKNNKTKAKSPEFKKTERGKNKVLSKSQKRKLKKLAEEKEKEELLAKSFKTLEKFKINEDLYSLLWSSQSIGQAETSREKRRRVVQLSKAGFEVPDNSDLPFKRKALNDDSCQGNVRANESLLSKVSDDSVMLPSVAVERRYSGSVVTLPIDAEGLGHGKVASTNTAAEEDSGVDACKSMQDEVKYSLKTDLSMVKSVQHCGQPCAFTTPTIVHVSRPKEVESQRKDLPVAMMEQEIMEAINEHSNVIICGETGSGKTTQVPQFLYEAGFGSKTNNTRSGIIGVTQPRRVAVLSTAKRVAFELGLRLGKEVGFQVRHDKKIGENCTIKFMTDGILLREVQSDFLLQKYSVIILDEAHERSLSTDILIGMLSRVTRQRQVIYEEQQQNVLAGQEIDPQSRIYPLKLILMSATLRVEDFTSGRRIFYDPLPVINIPTRQFEVTIHFSKRTEIVDYVGQAYKKVLSIHKNLPPGGVLVFVTGQREVEYLCRKLRKASKELVKRSSKDIIGNEVPADANPAEIDGFDMKDIDEALDVHANSSQQENGRFSIYGDDSIDDMSDSSYDSKSDSDMEYGSHDEYTGERSISEADCSLPDILGENGNLDSLKAAFEALDGKSASRLESEGDQINLANAKGGAIESNPSPKIKKGRESGLNVGPMHVLPLYAMLPAAAQLRVFGEIKDGERLVVVATNVAETSLTIPGIKYVVDTGREKVKNYNPSNGMESYDVQWISKASAAQRAGRAGRTGPGHCYRLYSAAAFTNHFSDFSCPEILKTPVDGVVLLMKSMRISKVANFPFPTPPAATALAEAESCLKALEALDGEGRLTPLGKTMAQYPMSPRHSRMLLTAICTMKREKHYIRPNLVLGYAVAAASALSFSNPFVLQFEGSDMYTVGMQQDEKSGSLDSEQTIEKEKLVKRKLKDTVKIARAKFSNLRSDALTIAYALQCFELSKNPSVFCSDNALHLKTMEEMSKLRKQLLQLVFKQRFSGLEQEFSWTFGTIEDVEHAWSISFDNNPLTQIEEDLLCQAICAGWADRVARRIRGSSGLLEGDNKVNAVRYQACMVKETVFLHRWSTVAKSGPEFLVYSELLHSKRPYIHGATSVNSEWLTEYAGSLCTYSAPLSNIKPGYDPHDDKVFCHVIPYFGPHLWELPYSKVPIKDTTLCVAVFAYALLDGQVLPSLKSVRKFMAAPPSSILRPEASGQKRVGNLLNKLRSRSKTIDSCIMLRDLWMENPRALYAEILDWFQSGFRDRFEELWKNMHHEVLLAPQDRLPYRTKGKKNRS